MDVEIAKAWDRKFQQEAKALADKLDRLYDHLIDNPSDEARDLVFEIAEWASHHVGHIPMKNTK